MPVLNTKEDLVAALQNSLFAADPIADLAQKGFTLSPTLNAEWQTARAGKKLAPIAPKLNPSAFKTKFVFQSAPSSLPVFDIPAGSYDVTAGLTVAVANEVLAAEYQSGFIPHQIALDQSLSPADLSFLAGFFKVDRPGGQISKLHITAAPTLSATTDGSEIVALQIPIQIDWDRTVHFATGQVQQLVTTATGTMTLTMSLVGSMGTTAATMNIAITLVVDPSSAAESPHLILDASSPVQLVKPVPPDQIDEAAKTIQLALAFEFHNNLTFPVSPIFNLSIGSLSVKQLDAVATGGVIVAGVKLAETGGVQGNTATLANLLPDSVSNIFLQMRDVVPNALLQQALANGTLTRQAQAQHSNAVVDSASAVFQNNSIVMNITGHLKGECGFDLGFWATHTISLKVQGNSLEVDQTDSSGVDASYIWCVLLALSIVGLLSLAGWLFISGAAAVAILETLGTLVGTVSLIEFINGLSSSSSSTIVALNQPIPGTDVLPTLGGGAFSVSNGVLLIAATAATTPDNLDKHIYIRFLAPRPGSAAVGDNVPLAGVNVQMWNQNVPWPSTRQAPTLPPNTSVTINPNPYSNVPAQIIDTAYSFDPATADQNVAQGVTNSDGLVRFELLQGQFPIEGTIVATITTGYDTDYPPPMTTTQETPVPDPSPDLYFLVTQSDGTVVDSRKFGGFLSNLTAAQVGSLSNPLTITFGTTVGGLL